MNTGRLNKEEKEQFDSIIRQEDCHEEIERNAEDVRLIIAAYNDKITLKECTDYIKANANTVMKVAEALYKVKENRLYLLKYKTFEAYVNDQFNFTRERAYQLTRAHEVAEDVNNAVDKKVIVNESQARALLKLLRFTDDNKVDKQATLAARTELVRKVMSGDARVSSKMITKNVSDARKTSKVDKFKHLSEDKHQNALTSIINSYKNRLKRISENSDVSQEAKSKLKDDSIKSLKKLIDELRKQE